MANISIILDRQDQGGYFLWLNAGQIIQVCPLPSHSSPQQYLVICLFLFPGLAPSTPSTPGTAGANLIFQDVTTDIILINQ